MEDLKKLTNEFYSLVLEEHVLLAIAAITGSENMTDKFMDKSKDVSEFLIKHDKELRGEHVEVEANEELNSEV